MKDMKKKNHDEIIVKLIDNVFFFFFYKKLSLVETIGVHFCTHTRISLIYVVFFFCSNFQWNAGQYVIIDIIGILAFMEGNCNVEFMINNC